jgi:hypothetical protein
MDTSNMTFMQRFKRKLSSQSKTFNGEEVEGFRRIQPLSNEEQGFAKNKIKTSKYTWLTFLPKNIVEQFSKFANCFFLMIAIM